MKKILFAIFGVRAVGIDWLEHQIELETRNMEYFDKTHMVANNRLTAEFCAAKFVVARRNLWEYRTAYRKFYGYAANVAARSDPRLIHQRSLAHR